LRVLGLPPNLPGNCANRASRDRRGFNLCDTPSERRPVPPTFRTRRPQCSRNAPSAVGRAQEGRGGQLFRRHSGGQDADMTGRSARFIRASRAPSRSFSSSDATRSLWLHVAAISLPRSTESRALPLVQSPPLQATPLQARASRKFSTTHHREATAEGLVISWPRHVAGWIAELSPSPKFAFICAGVDPARTIT
jgi:hypothetical protein